MYKEPQKQICWYYGFFQAQFSFCEFFIIKVGLPISDLDMSIFGIKLFDIYLETKKVFFF